MFEYYMYIIISVLIFPSLIYGVITQVNVTQTFNKFKEVKAANGKTAREVARMMLDSAGLSSIEIKQIRGDLTDNYDPVHKVLNLSETTYNSSSVSAIGVAAHEVGHAIQHKQRYTPLVVRNLFVPIVNFASGLFWIVFLAGIVLSAIPFIDPSIGFYTIWVSVALYGSSTLFYLITLPVEFNASRRAMANLENQGILNQDELPMARKTLKAAAETYVAALVTSALYFLRFLLRVMMMLSDRD